MADEGKYALSSDDLLALLCEQLSFLRASAAAYDAGTEEEAKRLATTIRVLFHDTKASKSLLHQLKMKAPLRLYRSGHDDHPGNLMPFHGLVGFSVTAVDGKPATVTFALLGPQEAYRESADGEAELVAMKYVPYVNMPADSPGNRPSQVSFTRWWEAQVIRDANGATFTRRDLVLGLSNKDGGAHVDPKLDEAYAKLSRFNSMSYRVKTGDSEAVRPPDNSVVAASMRQIAEEVLTSIGEQFPGNCS